MTRSVQPEVRNPLLALPSARRVLELDPDTRAVVAAILKDLSADARERGEKAWRTGKAPMAVYWRAVAVYAGHLKRLLNRPPA